MYLHENAEKSTDEIKDTTNSAVNAMKETLNTHMEEYERRLGSSIEHQIGHVQAPESSGNEYKKEFR